jgi:hypothetical protein
VAETKSMADVLKSELNQSFGPMQVTSRKHFMHTSDGPPTFINSVEFAAMGMEVFMDVGIVPVESVASAAKLYQENPTEAVPVDFHISFRFGMSFQAAIMMHQRLTQLVQQFQQSVEQGKVTDKGGSL